VEINERETAARRNQSRTSRKERADIRRACIAETQLVPHRRRKQPSACIFDGVFSGVLTKKNRSSARSQAEHFAGDFLLFPFLVAFWYFWKTPASRASLHAVFPPVLRRAERSGLKEKADAPRFRRVPGDAAAT
jgi:hypothetical protein